MVAKPCANLPSPTSTKRTRAPQARAKITRNLDTVELYAPRRARIFREGVNRFTQAERKANITNGG